LEKFDFTISNLETPCIFACLR